MIYGSVCSGIEAASVAWHPLGWTPSFFSEIEAFPRAVLAHHHPEVPLHGDFTTIKAGDYRPIDLLVGGTPCQSFSIAGLRKGLDDDRGNLALEYLRLADRLRPQWLVWENVPGVLSSSGGRDFGAFLGGLVQLGYGFAYRVLDAQYFGVAQRRRRVYVVGYLGDWRPAAAVLFERHSLQGHPAPSRGQGPGIAPAAAGGVDESGIQHVVGTLCTDPHPGAYSGQDAYTGRLVPQLVNALTANAVGTCGADDSQAQGNHLLPIAFSAKDHGADATFDLSPTLRAGGHNKSHANAGVMPAVAFSIMPMNSGTDYKARETDIAQPVMTTPVGGNQGGDYVVECIPIDTMNHLGRPEHHDRPFEPGAPSYTLTKGNSQAVAHAVAQPMAFDAVQITSAANRTRFSPELPASTLAKGSRMHVAYPVQEVGKRTGTSTTDPRAGIGVGQSDDPMFTLQAGAQHGVATFNDDGTANDGLGITAEGTGPLQRSQHPAVATAMRVRRLTPTECERLQGFPDGWTQVPYRGKPASDGPRYKAIGNSMAVPVMAWIGRRIQAVSEALA